MTHRKMAVIVITAMAGVLSAALTASAAFVEDFSSYPADTCYSDGGTFGPWTSSYNGYGCNKVETDGTKKWLHVAPMASASPAETHAGLVLGPSFTNPLDYSVKINNVAQLRKNSAPNAWEVGWIGWNFTDNDNFYYFVPRANGWELGKRDPAYPFGQRFMATGTSGFPLGVDHTIRVTQDTQNKIQVYVDGSLITTFTDTERPLTSGRIALYSEDAHVHFDDISVNPVTSTPPPPSACVTSAGTWQNVALPSPQTGTFTATFDATPNNANMDGVVGLSNASANGYPSLAAIVRFNNVGRIDARNGGAYSAATVISYSPGTLYKFRLVVNVSAKTYSAYVKTGTGAEQLIGSNYAFRAEQMSVSSLNNSGVYASVGSETVCNVALGTVTGDTTAPVISGVGSSNLTTTGATIGWTTNEASDSQVEYGVSTSYGQSTVLNTSAVNAHSVVLSALSANTQYNYRVKSKDVAGNLSVSGNFTFRTASPTSTVLFSDNFNRPDGVIANERETVRSPDWDVTSGTFYIQNNAGWTGNPSSTNNSYVFRAVTRRTDFQNVEVSFSLLNQGLTSGPSTPAVAWDGTHIFLRYQSEYNLYYASINRRDNTVIIKKKVQGGPSNGGTYYNLTSSVRYTVPYNQWQNVKATVQTNSNNSVTIRLYANNNLLLTAVDNGSIGGAPILKAGRVGFRGDNANLKVDNFVVTPIGVSAPIPSESSIRSLNDQDVKAGQKFLSPALADGINDAATFGLGAHEVSVMDVQGRRVFHALQQGTGPIIWNCKDDRGQIVESGVYIAKIHKENQEVIYQSFAVVK